MPDLQGTEPTEALILDRVMWVPHYRELGVYVAPGNAQRTRADLMRAGARIGVEQLWPRPRDE